MRISAEVLNPSEPIVKGKTFEHNSEYVNVLNYYNLMTTKQAKQYLLEWAQTHDREAFRKLSKVPLDCINKTAAKIARIVMRGGQPPESSFILMQDKLEEMYGKMVEDDPTKPKINVQKYMTSKAGNIQAELEGMIDDGASIETFMQYFKEENFSGIIADRLRYHFQPIVDELELALEGKIDGYEFNDRKSLERDAKKYKDLLKILDEYSGNKKKDRMPRKKKQPTPEKLLKHLKFLEKDSDFNLASINPERIIGCQELWTFNVKTKMLTVYRALDRGGLSVKRSYITNYNEKQSVAKRIGRKTNERIKIVLEGGKVALGNLMISIPGESNPVSRINEATILLRAR